MSDLSTNAGQDQSYVAFNFSGVENLATEMEDLATRAKTLQDNLDSLEAELRNNWQDDAANRLLLSYSDFVNNVNIITTDIYSVRDWARDTSVLFSAAVKENESNIDSALAQG